LSRVGFGRMVERAAAGAELKIKAHAHMLRHACGFKLAKAGRRHPGATSPSGIAKSSTRSVIRSWRRTDLKIFGGTKAC
jgi:hypothetical protein